MRDQDKRSVERNAKRRKMYAEDKDFRDKAIESTRANYRSVNDGLVDDSTCLDNVDDLDKFGTKRRVEGDRNSRLTFYVKELAAAMNRRAEVVYRWVRRGMFPPPTHQLEEPTSGHQFVYLRGEARALAEVMGDHQLDTPYYRADHVDTRERLFEAVDGSEVDG